MPRQAGVNRSLLLGAGVARGSWVRTLYYVACGAAEGISPHHPPGRPPRPLPVTKLESAAYELRLPGPRLACYRAIRYPESRCVGAVWAVNKPGRDARRLDHGNRPRQKQRTRRRGTADRGVSAVRGGPWPDVPNARRETHRAPVVRCRPASATPRALAPRAQSAQLSTPRPGSPVSPPPWLGQEEP